MASTADFKNGLCLEMSHDLWTIIEFLHVKPGKGPAFVRTKLKSLTSGKVVDKTWNSGEKVTTARIERRAHQFLFKDEMGYTFMDNESFEQIIVEESLIDNHDLLTDGLEVDILYHVEKDMVLGVELPQFVVLTVTYTEPGLRGDTASGNATKPATLETGANIQVPLFVNQDTKIKIDTKIRSYVERVK